MTSTKLEAATVQEWCQRLADLKAEVLVAFRAEDPNSDFRDKLSNLANSIEDAGNEAADFADELAA